MSLCCPELRLLIGFGCTALGVGLGGGAVRLGSLVVAEGTLEDERLEGFGFFDSIRGFSSGTFAWHTGRRFSPSINFDNFYIWFIWLIEID